MFLEIDEWVNKTLGFRDERVFFNDPDRDVADYYINRWLPTHEIETYMEYVWPWLKFSYFDELPDRSGFEEVACHRIEVELNDIGKSFICLEKYYADGLKTSDQQDGVVEEDDTDFPEEPQGCDLSSDFEPLPDDKDSPF